MRNLYWAAERRWGIWEHLALVAVVFLALLACKENGPKSGEPKASPPEPKGELKVEKRTAKPDKTAKSAKPTGSGTAAEAPKKTGRFPALVTRFYKLNELKQDRFAKSFPGTVMKGTGKVFDVEKCGLLDDSTKYGSDCVKLTLDSGQPRIVLYYDQANEDEIMNLNKGDKVTFKGCVGVDIKNWGFWSTATCDMP